MESSTRPLPAKESPGWNSRFPSHLLIPILAVIILAFLANSVRAQVQIPTFVGLWCPRNLSEATYRVEDELAEVEFMVLAVAHSERLEITTTYLGLDHHRIIQLFVPAKPSDYRLVGVRCEESGLPARDLPPALWRGGGGPLPAAKLGERLPDEKVVVPAGVFSCTHFRIKDAEVWLCPSVSPYGIVRYKAPGIGLTLLAYKEGTDEQKH